MKSEWPVLSYRDAKETYATLHLWTQILGKIKLAKLPWINHSWHVTLLVTSTGLTTSDIPDTNEHFQIDLDLVRHQLIITNSSGQTGQFTLKNISVADFYRQTLEILADMKIEVEINPVPNELENVVPFTADTVHRTYDIVHASALHKALLKANSIFTQFRSEFKGKCSPVHFFWGGFDLAVSRFSGRPAPKHPGGVPNLPDKIAQEAYSHEVSSCGFWPGNDAVPYAAFYSYIYPEPDGFKNADIEPVAAYYHNELGEYILPYDSVQQSGNPEESVLSFLRSTYDAAADLAHWDKRSFEASF